MSNEALTWAKIVSHEMASRYEHFETAAEEAGEKKPKNPYTGTPHAVLWVLADYANEDWRCWPLHSTLARDLGGVSTRTIVRAIKTLEEFNLVSKVHYTTETGSRAGSVFQLHVETLDALEQENRKMGIPENGRRFGRSRKLANTCGDNLSRRRQKAIEDCGDNLSLGDETPVNTCGDNLSLREPKRQKRQDLSDNYDISAQVPLKDHARINHHHQSSDARDATIDDDDDDQKFYRRVNLQQLIEEVPGLSGYAGQLGLICGAIDVVLNRASGRIANPTAYLRRALSEDLYGVLGSVPDSSMLMGKPMRTPSPSSIWFDPLSFEPATEQRLSVVDRKQEYLGLSSNESSGANQDLSVPSLETLSHGDVPCTNLDHLNNYEMSNRQLANCNHCRVEQQTADEDHYPHIANATAAQIGALPPRLQRWVEQFRDGEPVGDQD